MSLAEYDDLVTRLKAAGVGDDAAHRYAADKFPAAARAANRDATRHADVLEKTEQLEVAKLFRGFGFKVRTLSQPRATKQAPGLFDLWCVHRELPIAFWWDVKRQVGGKLSDAQTEFLDDCQRCGVGVGYGDRYDARVQLVQLGIAHVVGDTLEPIRRTA